MALPVGSLTGTVRPFWAFFVDFDGDPIYASTLPGAWTPVATGLPELDGNTFVSLPAQLVSVDAVTNGSGGTDQVGVTLSGVPGADDGVLAAIADLTKWRGREFHIWWGLADASFTPTLVAAQHVGYMVSVDIEGDSTTQSIRIVTENYLATFTRARGRTYQDQAEHDATDNSGPLIRAAANGIQTAGGFSGFGGPLPFDQRSPNDWDGGFG